MSAFEPSASIRNQVSRPLGLSQTRIHILGQLIDAFQIQIGALYTGDIRAVLDDTTPVLLLAGRLKDVDQRWIASSHLLSTSGPDSDELRVGNRLTKDFCLNVIRFTLINDSSDPPYASVTDEMEEMLDAMVVSKRRWEQGLASRVVAGYVEVVPDDELIQDHNNFISAHPIDAVGNHEPEEIGFDQSLTHNERSNDGLPRYQGPEYGPPGYSAEYRAAISDFDAAGVEFLAAFSEYRAHLVEYSAALSDFRVAVAEYTENCAEYIAVHAKHNEARTKYKVTLSEYQAAQARYSSARATYHVAHDEHTSGDSGNVVLAGEVDNIDLDPTLIQDDVLAGSVVGAIVGFTLWAAVVASVAMQLAT